ncbi:unnamed protein product [Pleuronectes platessa]|uniref:Uncharacterized protein n=1 Tax=Pleuronectes platessa TaxID=8262 RepID=A0A9N7TKB3_PLEPL|nr:unnamed protein product [Pleuronectes platessa]
MTSPRLQEEHMQLISFLSAALTSSQKELVAQLRLRYQEELELQESLRALDEEKVEISKIRSALAQHVKDTEKLKHQWERDQSRLPEELTRSQEEKLKLLESPRTAPQAVDKEKEEGKMERSNHLLSVRLHVLRGL